MKPDKVQQHFKANFHLTFSLLFKMALLQIQVHFKDLPGQAEHEAADIFQSDYLISQPVCGASLCLLAVGGWRRCGTDGESRSEGADTIIDPSQLHLRELLNGTSERRVRLCMRAYVCVNLKHVCPCLSVGSMGSMWVEPHLQSLKIE